jgi:Phage tail tube protein
MAVAIGVLRACGIAKESSPGTLNATPDVYLPFIPPDGFSPAITLLESQGIRALADKVYKVAQGPGEIKSAKLVVEFEPENCGQILMAAFGTDTKTGPADTTAYTHTFSRVQSSALPQYSFWFDRGNSKYAQFFGCMLSKLDIDIKAKDFVKFDQEWVGLGYDDTGTAKSPTYSALKPLRFNQVTVSVAGSGSLNYENLKITIDNQVKADHGISGSIYPAKIYSEGLLVTLTADFFFDNTTEYAKYLSGTSSAFIITLTSGEKVTGAATTYNSLTINMPNVNYQTAPLVTPAGIVKIPFVGRAVYDTGTSKTINAVLVNSVSAAY